MAETDYTKLTPAQPSTELVELAKIKYAETNALIFRVDYERNILSGERTKYVKCTCTACNGTFAQTYTQGGCCYHASNRYGFYNERTHEHITSYNSTLCPKCGAPVEAISISSMRDEANLASNIFAEIRAVDGNLAILSYWIEKTVDKEGAVSIRTRPAEAYIAVGKKMIKLVGYQRYFDSYTLFNEWHQRKRCDDTFVGFNNVTLKPFGEDELVGTCCENSKLDIFASKYPQQIVSYLRLWQKHKCIENLITQGCSKIVSGALTSATDSSCGYYYTKFKGSINVQGLDLKQAKPHKILGVTKEEYKQVKKRKWTFEFLQKYKRNKAYDRNVTPENAKAVEDAVGYLFDRVEKTGESLVKITNYLQKQKKKHPPTAGQCDLRTLLDYWELCKERDIDLNDVEERYPQNLVAKHDQLVELAEFERKKERLEAFEKRAEKLAPFAFADEETGLMISACPDEAQLINEGKTLHHCVATYAKAHAHGDTAIFFIRHIDKPDEPFFTLELDEKTYMVRQNRGLRNCARTPEVEAFEKKWIEHLKINNIGKEVKKNGKCTRKSDCTAAVA